MEIESWSGVSGGPDSICLVDILNCIRNDKRINLNFHIAVAHINHMIREEALSDEEFVRKYCDDRKIPFFSKQIDIKKMSVKMKIGTEEAGRIARYEFFNEILDKEKYTKIATAHNKCDNGETVLMNIIRGSRNTWIKRDKPQKR